MVTIAVSLSDTATKSAIEEFCKKESHKLLFIENLNKTIDSLQEKFPEIFLIEFANLTSDILESIRKIKNESALKDMTIFTYLGTLDVKTEVALRKFKLSSFFLKNSKNGLEQLVKGLYSHIKGLESNTKNDVNEKVDKNKEIYEPAEKGIETYYELGKYYMDKDLYQKAIKSFYDAAKSPEMYFPATHMIGICYYRMGRNDKAITVLLKGFKTAGTHKERTGLGYELGNVLCEIGRKKDALKVYEIVCKLDPDFLDIKERISNLNKNL